MWKYFELLPLCLLLNISLAAQVSQKDSTFNFFPESRIYPVIILDPLECQIMGGSYFLFQENNDLSLYSTINLGFSKPVMGKAGKNI